MNGADGAVPFGFLPGGGTSVLPRALGLPRDPVAAAQAVGTALATNRFRRISLGDVNGRRFCFSAGIGFDAEAVRRLDELGRDAGGARPGDTAFLRMVGKMMLERRGRWDPELEIDGVGRAAFVLVANGNPYSYAGSLPLRVVADARFEDGIDFTAPPECAPATSRSCSRPCSPAAAAGAGDLLAGHDLDRIEVHCDRPLPLQADGEDLGDVDGGGVRGRSATRSQCSSRFRPRMAHVPLEPRRVLDGDAPPAGLGESDLLELYRRMVLLRTYDERSVVYHRQGRIGTYAIFWNHEAIQAGATFALGDDDWIFPSYRESAIGLRARNAARDDPAVVARPSLRAGGARPTGTSLRSACRSRLTCPHAAGLAWGKKLRGEDAVAMAFFGDGATSEGAFHEGVNLAAVMDAPVVFVCNNNQWAISTPVEAQTRARTLADKAVGYGIPGVRVDGLDVLAVYEAAREAVERARAGDGPTLIEAVHYRAAPHATADDPRAYIDLARVEEERARECVGRYEAFLKRLGVLTDEHAALVRTEART